MSSFVILHLQVGFEKVSCTPFNLSCMMVSPSFAEETTTKMTPTSSIRTGWRVIWKIPVDNKQYCGIQILE